MTISEALMGNGPLSAARFCSLVAVIGSCTCTSRDGSLELRKPGRKPGLSFDGGCGCRKSVNDACISRRPRERNSTKRIVSAGGGWEGPMMRRRGTMKKLIVAVALTGFIATPALADFWIVREDPTGQCRVVETKPTDSKIIIVGNKVYKTRDEATKEIAVV